MLFVPLNYGKSIAFATEDSKTIKIIPKSQLRVEGTRPYLNVMMGSETVAEWDAQTVTVWADDLDAASMLLLTWFIDDSTSF